MAVADTRRREARRGLRGREARPPARPDPREDRRGRLRGAVAVRDLLGAQPGARAALPHELPAVALAHDVPRLPRLGHARRGRPEAESPGVTDWLLALGSVVALGYTLVTFDEFVRRAAQPNDLDIAFGVATILLVLEATRRTVGWILPAVVIGFLLYAYFGGELPVTWEIAHARLRRAAHRRPDLHGPAGHLRRPARRRRHLHRAVHALRRGARVLGRRAASSSTSRSPPPGSAAPAPAARPRWPASCSARCRAPASPPRSRSAASPGRSCAAAATPRTRAAACSPPPASARSCRRRRSAPPRSSSPSSSRSPT